MVPGKKPPSNPVSNLASNAYVGRCSIVERQKPCVQIQTEPATETVRSEADSAANAPVFVLIVPEGQTEPSAFPIRGKAGMEYAVHGHRASCLSTDRPSGPIPRSHAGYPNETEGEPRTDALHAKPAR